MIISGFKNTERQLSLFERPLGNHGNVRNCVGDLIERLTCKLVGGRRHKTQSRADYCPDVSNDSTYFETKAVGRSRTAFIYAGRLQKDWRFSRTEDLVYVIWHHFAATKSVATVEQLEALILTTMRAVYLVPFAAVARLCENRWPEKLNSGYGGTNRKVYGSGYRIHLNQLQPWLFREFRGGYAR